MPTYCDPWPGNRNATVAIALDLAGGQDAARIGPAERRDRVVDAATDQRAPMRERSPAGWSV